MSAKISLTKVFLYTLLVTALFFSLLLVIRRESKAAVLTNASVRLGRMQTSEAASATQQILVVVTPTTASTEASLKITWTGYTVNATPSNHTVTTTGIPTTYQGLSITAWPGIGSAASAVSGDDVTYSSTDLVVGTSYGFFITGGITNPGSANSYPIVLTTQASGPSTIDTQTVATRIVTGDRITLSATVPPIFSFTLGATSDSFTSNLSTSSVVSTTGVTVTVATNAEGGWGAYVKSANAALNSSSTGDSIATSGSIDGAPTTLSTGSEGYVLDVNLTTDSGTGTGTVTIAAEYNGTTTSAGGTLSSSALQEIATANGTTDGDVLTLIARATISAVTLAATDYADTLTVVGAGNF